MAEGAKINCHYGPETGKLPRRDLAVECASLGESALGEFILIES